jgi:hypothetical protein
MRHRRGGEHAAGRYTDAAAGSLCVRRALDHPLTRKLSTISPSWVSPSTLTERLKWHTAGGVPVSRKLRGAQRIPALTSSMAAMIPECPSPRSSVRCASSVPTSTRSTSWLSVSIRRSTLWTSSSTADSMRSVASSPRFYVSSAVDSRTSGCHRSPRDPLAGHYAAGRAGRRHAQAQSSGTSRSISSCQVLADLSDGARQSPRGDSDPPWDTLGPFGNADRLNWLNV